MLSYRILGGRMKMGWEKCEEDAQANTRSFKVLVWIKESSLEMILAKQEAIHS